MDWNVFLNEGQGGQIHTLVDWSPQPMQDVDALVEIKKVKWVEQGLA